MVRQDGRYRQYVDLQDKIEQNKTMRFGFWPNPRSNYEATKTLAQHAEATAGTAFGSPTTCPRKRRFPVHECWVTMAALARDVPRVV